MTTNSNPSRPCRSKEPARCPYHRNQMFAKIALQQADAALAKGNSNEFFEFNAHADRYLALQRRIEDGDTVALQETRDVIAAQYPTTTSATVLTEHKLEQDDAMLLSATVDEIKVPQSSAHRRSQAVSPRDVAARSGGYTDGKPDTPLEHVITLPTFDEIASFLRGKRRK